MFLVSSLFFFVWFPCGRLSWLHVSFWAHVNIVHHIISYHIICGLIIKHLKVVIVFACSCLFTAFRFCSVAICRLSHVKIDRSRWKFLQNTTIRLAYLTESATTISPVHVNATSALFSLMRQQKIHRNNGFYCATPIASMVYAVVVYLSVTNRCSAETAKRKDRANNATHGL